MSSHFGEAVGVGAEVAVVGRYDRLGRRCVPPSRRCRALDHLATCQPAPFHFWLQDVIDKGRMPQCGCGVGPRRRRELD
jgi:hypothetical protein